jgi:Domain of unknown function (DUF4386)
MTSIRESLAPAHATELPRAETSETNRSVRRASVTAGASLLVLTALAVFSNFIVLGGLVSEGDAARTAADISASEGMFRLGVVSWVLVVVLDVVIAWALLAVFRPVSSSVSSLAAWFRLAYAAVLLVAVGQLVGVPRLLDDEVYLSVFSTDQLHAEALLRIATFDDIYDAGLVLFGVHLLLIGYLAFVSGYVPRLLGVLIAIAGFGYVFDGFAEFLSQCSAIGIGGFTFIGEFLLALWLLLWGRRVTVTGYKDPADVPNSLEGNARGGSGI